MSDVVKEIEISMETVKKKIEKAELLERLCKNSDFKKLFLDDFCDHHALSLLSKKASPNYQDSANQQYINGQLSAVGHINLYMQYIRQEGQIAREALKEATEERNRALEEGI